MPSSILSKQKDIKAIAERFFLKDLSPTDLVAFKALKKSVESTNIEDIKKYFNQLQNKNVYIKKIDDKPIVIFNIVESLMNNVHNKNAINSFDAIEYIIDNMKDKKLITDKNFEKTLSEKKEQDGFNIWLEMIRHKKESSVRKIIISNNDHLFVKKNPATMINLLNSQLKRKKARGVLKGV